MKIIWEKDGCGLFVDDGTLWLFVRDGAGMHSTGLTDEARVTLRHLLGANATDHNSPSADAFVRLCKSYGERGLV